MVSPFGRTAANGDEIALSVRNRVWLFADTRVCGLIGMPNRRFVTFSANSVAGEKELRWVLVGWPTLFLLSFAAKLPRKRARTARAFILELFARVDRLLNSPGILSS